MSLPTSQHEEIRTAKFSHVAHLYVLKEHKSLKIAHNLKKVSLNPSSIARTSPQHALGKF